MAPTGDGDQAASSGLSIRGAAAAASASASTSNGPAPAAEAASAKPTTGAAPAGGRRKISLALRPTVQKSPLKASPPKALFEQARSGLTASKDVKRASNALADITADSSEATNGHAAAKPILARNSSSSSSRVTNSKGKARASEEAPAAAAPALEDPSDLKALEALKQGDLPASFLQSDRSPSPRRTEERQPEKQPRSPRARSRSPPRRRHPDHYQDANAGLPYDGETSTTPVDRVAPSSSSRERPYSPPRRRDDESERRRRLVEEERKQDAIRAEQARYRDYRRDDDRSNGITPIAPRTGGYDSDRGYDDYGDAYRRSGHGSHYPRHSTGYHSADAPLDYGSSSTSRPDRPSEHDRSYARHYDDRPRHEYNSHRRSHRDDRDRYDSRRDSHRDHRRCSDEEFDRPAKRSRRDSTESPRRTSRRERSASSASNVPSGEEGEIEEEEKSILDASSRQRVNARLTQKDRSNTDDHRSHQQYGQRDQDRYYDERDRNWERRTAAAGPAPHLPPRPGPPHPPPHAGAPYPPLDPRDPLALPPRPLGAPTLPPPPPAMAAQPPLISNGHDAARLPTYGAVLPMRPPPPPIPELERPQAPYHPAVPVNTNGPAPSVTPIDSATTSRAMTPAAAAPVEQVEHPPPAVRTQRPHEELWLRSLEPNEEIEGIFAGSTAEPAASPPSPSERKYVGCSHISEYTLQEKLGEGTFGVVWKGLRGGSNPATKMSAQEEAQLLQRGLRVKRGDVVALKQIIFHNEGDGLPITSVREIRILKMLDHPNVVPVVDIAYEPADHANFKLGKTFMVFPYMDHDLAGLLENRNVRLETAHIKQYSKQLLEGTAYLHRNLILHRDMKAANLLINNQGQLMIADFGLARSIHKAEENAAYTSCVVTRWYRPPELLLGEKRYHTPVDMWGVACVMAEMYHRSPIFPGQSDFDQAVKIFTACGPPTAESMPGWNNLPGVEGHEQATWPDRGRAIKADWTARVDPLFGDLIDRILVLDPKKRLTAVEALDHEWFWTEPYPTDPSKMPQYKASHEMDGRKRKEEQHAAFGAVQMQPPMQPFPPQPNGMRPNGPVIPAYGAPPPPQIPAYNGGQPVGPPLPPPPPVGAYNGPPQPMPRHPQQPPPPPSHMGGGGYGAGPSGMNVGMGFRQPANQNHSYAAAGPPIATAGGPGGMGVGGMQARGMQPGGGRGQYENMRQGPSWQNKPSAGPTRTGGINLFDKLKRPQ
ncbi:hypothetical protein JCM10908_002094 [Rhodotorula pacifica]|uniref:uncharacterized protein n=1 Tax=Rhodotorula pacifica TaxID=1495444 RepID=UPI0031805189